MVGVGCGGFGGYGYDGDSFLFELLGGLEEAGAYEGYVESASHGCSEDCGGESYASLLGDDDCVDSCGFGGSEYVAEVHGVVESVEEDEGDVALVLGEELFECGGGRGLYEGDDSLVAAGLGEGV